MKSPPWITGFLTWINKFWQSNYRVMSGFPLAQLTVIASRAWKGFTILVIFFCQKDPLENIRAKMAIIIKLISFFWHSLSVLVILNLFIYPDTALSGGNQNMEWFNKICTFLYLKVFIPRWACLKLTKVSFKCVFLRGPSPGPQGYTRRVTAVPQQARKSWK